tara:strand:+ start:1434 stop:2468 length:1035 start_codon:yes stop_codon:yes gene_type:complete
MENIIPFTISDLVSITNHRSGELKLGERIIIIPKDEKISDFILKSDAPFVLLGIPEDIGVKANYGKTGTASAYASTIKSLVNMQHNKFCKGNKIIFLGHINVEKEMTKATTLDANDKEQRKELFKLVEQIDKEVSHIIRVIVKSGKIPIIIGGGHNNAYGNIKGLALGKGKMVNAVNFDAHTDFRIMEGRHSGNGFTYAYENHFLKKYFIFGLHEGFISKIVLDKIKSLPETLKYNTYEEIEVRKEKNFDNELNIGLDFVKDDPFGIELDLDAIPGIYASAMTNSGFGVEKARQFIHHFGQHRNASYLHICEGAPDLDLSSSNHLTGKLIAYLITDFIKSKMLN